MAVEKRMIPRDFAPSLLNRQPAARGECLLAVDALGDRGGAGRRATIKVRVCKGGPVARMRAVGHRADVMLSGRLACEVQRRDRREDVCGARRQRRAAGWSEFRRSGRCASGVACGM